MTRQVDYTTEEGMKQILDWAFETVESGCVVSYETYWSWDSVKRNAFLMMRKKQELKKTEMKLLLDGNEMLLMFYKAHVEGQEGIVNLLKYLRKIRKDRK